MTFLQNKITNGLDAFDTLQPNEVGLLDTLSLRIDGRYDITLKVSGTVSGTVSIKTKKYVSDALATKLDITAAGDHTVTIGDDDNYLELSSGDTFTDLVIEMILKKKIVEGSGEVVDSVDNLPTSPSEGDRVTINDASILSQGGCVIDVIYCNGKWVTVGSNVIYRENGTTLNTAGNSSTWIQIGSIVIPREVVNKNVKAYALLKFPSGIDGSRGVRMGNRIFSKVIPSDGASTTVIEFRLQGVVDENKFVTTIASEVDATVAYTSTELQGTGNITLPIYLYSQTTETLTLTGLEVSI